VYRYGININRALVEQGIARVKAYASLEPAAQQTVDEWRGLEKEARANARGFWRDRCADVSLRFPSVGGLNSAPVDGSSESPWSTAVVQWVAETLIAERHGRVTPPLAQTAERVLLLSEEQWAEIRSWPTDSCEGAFVAAPRNAALVAKMRAVATQDRGELRSSSVVSRPQAAGSPSLAGEQTPATSSLPSSVDAATQEALKAAILDWDQLESEAYATLDDSKLHLRATGWYLEYVSELIAEARRRGVREQAQLLTAQFRDIRRVSDDRAEVDLVETWSVRYLDRDGRVVRESPSDTISQTNVLVREGDRWKIANIYYNAEVHP
jgi:hypothetical protein